MQKTRVLIVEDEQDIAGLIKHALERGGEIEAQTVVSGDTALKIATDQPPDLIILDLNLPVVGGLEVCRVLRARPATARIPIIMLTARTSESDRVTGLDVGADDYVTKPFSLRELSARVRAVLRRGKGEPAAPSVYRGRHLVADFDAVAVTVEGQAVRLTRREFELLKHLVENRNRVLSRDRLLERVWGYRPPGGNQVGGRARRAAAREAGPRGPANRNGRRARLPLRGVTRAPSPGRHAPVSQTLLIQPFCSSRTMATWNADRARSTRCQSSYTRADTVRLSSSSRTSHP